MAKSDVQYGMIEPKKITNEEVLAEIITLKTKIDKILEDTKILKNRSAVIKR